MNTEAEAPQHDQPNDVDKILNIAGYKFIRISEARIDEVRLQLKDMCCRNHLLGTVYLAREGINSFLAGEAADVRSFMEEVRGIREFAEGLAFKESWSSYLPFDKLAVRRKKEIIAMGVELDTSTEDSEDKDNLDRLGTEIESLQSIDKEEEEDTPQTTTATNEADNNEEETILVRPKEGQHISPQTLAAWIEEGRDMTVLDTRNNYEWRLGALQDSVTLDIETFRDFAKVHHHTHGNNMATTTTTHNTQHTIHNNTTHQQK